MKKFIVDKIQKIDKRYLIILIVAICVLMPYISNKFIKGHDYICHIANIYSMDKSISLKDFTIIPSKIRPIMARNFGYGNGLFYPQLSYFVTTYIYILVKHIGGSIITAVKFFEFIIVFLSGFFMYSFVKQTFNNKDMGLVSAIIYMCAPYFVSDVFIRIAYAEIPVFLFIPIVMIAITYLINGEYSKFLIYFVVGYSGMICSHLVLTIYLTILLTIVLMINIKKVFNRRAIISFFFAVIMVLGITLSFIAPMIQHKLLGNYVVFSDGVMADVNKLEFAQLDIYSIYNRYASYNNVFYYISWVSIFLIIIVIVNYKEIKKKFDYNQRMIMLSVVIFTICSFIFASKIINWDNMPKFLWNIQFPWRMSTFITFGISIIAGVGISAINKKQRKIVIIIICIICMMDVTYVVSKGNLQEVNMPTYNEVYSVNNRAMGSQKEYLPVKAKNNIEYLKNRTEDIIIKEGIVSIENLKSKFPHLEFNVHLDDEQKSVTLEIPRIYYLGYKIKIEKKDGKLETIEYYENNNGFIEFSINSSGKIVIDYEGTKLDKISNIISLMMIILLITLIARFYINEKIRSKNEFGKI